MDIGSKSIIERLYIFSFIAVLVLLPWSVRWCNYALGMMVITGLWSTGWREKIQRLREHREILFFIILFGLYVVGLFYTHNLIHGLKSVEKKLVLVVIPVLAASSIAFTDKQQKWALHSFAFSIALLTLVCVILNVVTISHGAPYPQINFDPHTLARFNALHSDVNPAWMQFSYIAFGKPIIGTPTVLSMYLLLSTLILFYWNPDSAKTSFLKYAGIVWFCIIIMLLSSRIGIFIFFIIAICNIFYCLSKRKLTRRYTAFSMIFGLSLGSLILFFPVTRFRLLEEPLSTPLVIPSNPTQWNSFNLRLLEWKYGIEGIKDHGFAGTGTGGTTEVLYNYYSQVDLGDFDNYYSSNNQFIEVFLEIGLAGFIALLLCFITPLVSGIKHKNMLLTSVVIMTCLGCLSNSLLEGARGLPFYVSFVSIFMFTKTKYDNETTK